MRNRGPQAPDGGQTVRPCFQSAICMARPLLAVPEVERSPERMSSAWVFRGSRVPVKALFENPEAGASVDDFVKWFPGVTKEQVLAVLVHVAKSLAVASKA
jgi:uncharacterized protein (DUF433 family)